MGALAVVWGLLFALTHLWWIIVGLLGAGVVHVVRQMLVSAAELRGLARREAAVVAARADRQQAQVLCGDVRGVYGEWPPA
jgi:apolipoprotein N-acyltransferase